MVIYISSLENVHSDPIPILNHIVWCFITHFLMSGVSSSCILEIYIFCNYFLSFSRLPFHFVDDLFPLLYRSFFSLIWSEVAQSCPASCNHMDCSLPGSSIHGILCWSGLPLPSPGDLPNPGIKPGSPALQADTSLSESPGKP